MTEDQIKLLSRNQQIIGPAIIDRYGLLVDFLDEAGLSDTENVIQKAHLLLPDLARWLATHPLSEEETADALLVIALFIGEIVAQRHQGCWMLVDKPGSPNFGSYVVTRFQDLPKGKVVNPFMVATEFLEERARGPFARGLEQVIDDVEKSLH